ncbi:MAG: inorganic diphosphatase [Armatimonadetes bacterium]|nr:inorganic diphosphatase [Armatimonadota bacterium]
MHDRIPVGKKAPWEINMIVEISKGSSNKYEFDPEFGVFRLDRVLYSPLYYPCDYGFVPSTLAGDGDPLDILVLGSHPTFVGCLVEVKPLGSLLMHDEKGEDWKVLAVQTRDPRFNGSRNLSDLSPHTLREIEHFFEVYKHLEEKTTEVVGWRGLGETHELILRSKADHERLSE